MKVGLDYPLLQMDDCFPRPSSPDLELAGVRVLRNCGRKKFPSVRNSPRWGGGVASGVTVLLTEMTSPSTL